MMQALANTPNPYPTLGINPNPTLQFVNSRYSPGGSNYVDYTSANVQNVPGSGNPFANFVNTFAPGAQQQAQQESQGGIMSPSNIYSGAKQLGQYVGDNYTNFTAPITSAINEFGAANFGFGSGMAPELATGFGADAASVATGFGANATAGAGSLTSATLSGTLGAAGIGALAGNFLGKIGGNETGGSVGGAVGAAIGNMILPGVGGIVGGLIGGIGGGFFGPKAGTAASEGNYRFNADGSVVYTGGGEKNPGQYAGFNQELGNIFAKSFDTSKQYLADLGLELKPLDFRAGANTLHSPSGQTGYIQVGGQTFGFDPNDPNSINKGIGQTMAVLARNSGATDEQIKQMADRINTDLAKSGQPNAPIIPLNAVQFAEYMKNYRMKQGTTNASA